jgi:hypothetical protein
LVRVLLRLFDTDFGDIQQLHAPTALRQQDGMASDSSSDIQSKTWKAARKKFIVGAHHEWIGLQ